MIKIKLEKNKSGKIIFKLKIHEDDKENILFKRVLIESKKIKGKGEFDYEVPLRFFIPICSNINKTDLILCKKSLKSYFEFSDFYDENYYTSTEINARYMKKWRDKGCPHIYKITIEENSCDIKKEVVFKKI
ncbi:hypothetical protein [Clostridium grantii]|uniref:Uncharacterized protein n=1 Tax=Clostridium grantii DSM 8605 TaxID=1121316 RepID=A0A1M5W0E6_9CLOT|nr:hypothetical protein [Clostridium grantii]SHH81059.1 hypothetical protein SAMN02745207_02603 [Clostridium grantii DSM 8605]